MTSREIRAALIMKGVSQRQIASDLNVSEACVSMVIRGSRKTPEVRKYIAQALDLPVRTVFPDQAAAS